MTTYLLYIDFDLGAIKESDIFLTIFGYVVVFIALTILTVFFNKLPVLLKYMSATRTKIKNMKTAKPEKPENNQIPGEVNAAIALALHLFFDDPHDEESTEFTIKKVSRNYSPWSSKIYNMDEYRRLKK